MLSRNERGALVVGEVYTQPIYWRLIVVEVLLALLGIGGLAVALSQVKSTNLPSEADFKKAKAKLDSTPEDPDANTIAGKYLAFVLGDYPQGLPYLSKSSDKTLISLADHENDPSYSDSPIKKVGLGDDWVIAAKSFPALSRIFYDHASKFYISAWPNLDEVWKDKARTQGRKLATARPQGAQRKPLPQGWKAGTWPGGRAPVIDGTVSHTGSYSVRLVAPDPKVKGSYSQLKSEIFPVAGAKSVEISAYVMSDGTEDATDRLYVNFTGPRGQWLGSSGPFIPIDIPFWNRISDSIPVPNGALQVEFWIVMYSKNGSILADDVSLKVDGKEILSNRSFEQ